MRALLEALANRQAVPGLVNHGLAVPGEVRAGLAHAGRRVHVGRRAARGHGAHHELAVGTASHGDGGGRQVRQDGCARERELGGRGDGHPHVFADLDADGQAGHVVGGQEDLAEGDPHGAAAEFFDAAPRHLDALGGARGHGDEVALLVELAVVRQVGLGDDRQHAAAVDGDGAVVQGVVLAQGRTHDEEGQQVGAGLDDLSEGLLDVIEQHVLQEKVVDGVAGHAQFGENAHRDAARIKLAGGVDDLARVLERASGVHGQGHGGNARKTLIVEGMEVHGSPLVLGYSCALGALALFIDEAGAGAGGRRRGGSRTKAVSSTPGTRR